MIHQLTRAARRIAVAALTATIPATAAIGWLNAPWTFGDVLILGAALWVLFAIVLAVPLFIQAIAARLFRRTLAAYDAYALAASTLLALCWVGRLKPAHQPFAAKPHLSATGAIELVLIGAAALAVWVAASRPARDAWLRLARAAAALTVSSALLALVAQTAEPRRDRQVAITAVTPPESHLRDGAAVASRSRVLVIAVDGLDWRPLQRLSQQGELPTLTRLIERGRLFQLDANGMAVSPPIWTALYTGSANRRNTVGAYTEWRVRGVSHPISFLPELGAHPMLMLDVLLDATVGLGLWSGAATSTANIVDPTIWEIASTAGRRVGVFDPVPYRVVGERINGSFAWRGENGYLVEESDGAKHRRRQLNAPLPSAFADAAAMLSTEQARADAALDVLGPDQDLAIYYTCVIDWLGHRTWDVRGSSLFPDAPLAVAYRQIDANAARLIARFGPPALVVLVSDHGWEFNEYEHFLSPYGVLVVSGTGATGYGGIADVLTVAPTVLSLLHLPIGSDMQPALADVTREWGSRTYGRAAHQFVADDPAADPERIDLLRSLGYVAR